MEQMQNLNLPHDQFFKKMMQDLSLAKDFFNDHLPLTLKQRIDLNTLKLQKDSFIEEELKKQLSDVLYKVNIDGEEGYMLILLEHQSSVDQLMAYRLWRYMFAIIDKHIGKSKAKPKLPVIIPIVIYNGQAKYTAKRNLWGLFEDPSLAKEVMSGDHLLIDVNEFSDSELKSRKIVGLMELMMKHIHTRDMLKHLKDVIEVLKLEYDEEIGILYLKQILWYSISKFQQEEKIELKNIIENNFKQSEEIMGTLVESWFKEGKEEGIKIGIEKGREEGIEEERYNVAKNLLSNNVDLQIIAKSTGLNISKLKEIKAGSFESKFKK